MWQLRKADDSTQKSGAALASCAKSSKKEEIGGEELQSDYAECDCCIAIPERPFCALVPHAALHKPLIGKETAMECTIRWSGNGMTFLAETGSNHVVAMDGAPDGGGRNLAPRPMEMVLVGTGGCTAYDVVVILKKSGQDVTGCEVKVTSERAPIDPKVFTKIHLHFEVRGRGLKRNLVEHAIRLSHEKYCSASIMLAKTAEITKDFVVIDE
jgi:putative redox protein